MNTIQKGAITEQKCILKCLEMGLNVSQPVLPARYDLIIEISICYLLSHNFLYKLKLN